MEEEEYKAAIEGEDMENKCEKSAADKAKMLADIVDNFVNVLDFLQAVSVNSPRIVATPLSLLMDKRAVV